MQKKIKLDRKRERERENETLYTDIISVTDIP
jgi:hypothetical protein